MHGSSHPVRLLPSLLLLGASVLLALLSWRWLQAELLVWQTGELFETWERRQVEEDWLNNPGRLSLVEWEEASRSLARARALHAAQPRFHNLQSRLALWRIHTPWQNLRDEAASAGPAEVPAQIVAEMLEQSWQAARTRPSWPYGWLEVVALHNANRVYDARFRVALVQTLQHGGMLRDVQLPLANMLLEHREVLEQGLAEWPESFELLRLNLLRVQGTSAPARRQARQASR